MRMPNDGGMALLEVLVALVIIGTAAIALIELEDEALSATAAARKREQEVLDADRLVTAYTLLNRTDLDQRLGDRIVGHYVVNVQRPERDLYRIEIGHLITLVYKPEPPDAK